MIYDSLLFHELTHAALSLLAAGITLLFFRKTKLGGKKKIGLALLGGFLGEFFLDVDHLFDWFSVFGFTFNIQRFFSGDMFLMSTKNYVPFHSWELIIVIAAIILIVKRTPWKMFLSAVTIGILLHLVYDMVFNHISFLGYSFIYRALHGFQAKYFTTDP